MTTIKQIKYVIKKTVGEEVLDLVSFLRKKDSVSEFKIAEHINQEINSTRSLLYKLHKQDLVSSIKKRDKETGWYVYYWSFKKNRVNQLINSIKEKEIELLENKLNKENNTIHFKCESGCIRIDFDSATNFNFRCPECGLVMKNKVNREEYICDLKSKIKKLKTDIK
ncbi:MAG: Transcription factor E [Candidatus Woesearchaeota archaeon]|nr:Transcription factor E [Candidatus Woesearchaeota archaeon]